MARRRRSALALSAEHAQQALAILVQEGKVKVSEVRKALQRRERLIRALRVSLAALGADAGSLTRRIARRAAPVLGHVAKVAAPMVGRSIARRAKPKRRKPRISAATRKMYQAQSRYMGADRPVSNAERATAGAIRENSGGGAVIAAVKRMAS